MISTYDNDHDHKHDRPHKLTRDSRFHPQSQQAVSPDSKSKGERMSSEKNFALLIEKNDYFLKSPRKWSKSWKKQKMLKLGRKWVNFASKILKIVMHDQGIFSKLTKNEKTVDNMNFGKKKGQKSMESTLRKKDNFRKANPCLPTKKWQLSCNIFEKKLVFFHSNAQNSAFQKEKKMASFCLTSKKSVGAQRKNQNGFQKIFDSFEPV